MDIVLQQIVNAISLGGIYALLALGLAVVFSIVSLINFAHGELMTVAGYGMFFAAAVSLPFPVAVAIAVVFAAIAAVLTERFAFRPMRKADATGLLLTSFAVSAILRVLFQNGISARTSSSTPASNMAENRESIRVFSQATSGRRTSASTSKNSPSNSVSNSATP